TQDHLGRMWFGTYDGLNCYDGSSIKTFRQIAVNKEKSLTDNQIESIYEDKNNVIWIFQPNGVISSLEDFETSRFRSYRLIPSHIPIEVVTSSRGGSILLKGPQGGFEYLEKEKTFVFRPELKETRIVPVLLKTFKKDNPHLLIQKYWEERQGTCFIATLKSGLIKLMEGTKGSYTYETIRQTSDQPYSLSNNEVYSVFTDRAGIMWLGTKDGGVNRLLPQARFLKTLCYKAGVEHSLPKGTIRAISEDHTGKIWIGTYNDGVAVLNPSTMSYTYINHSGNPANEDWDRVRCIYQTSDKRMWVASYGGLCAIEGKSQKREYFRPGSSSNTLTNGRIYSLAEDKYGFLWIGAWGGVDKLDLRTGKITRVLSSNLSDRHVRKIMFDKEGFLWIGTEFGGINKYNPVSNQIEVIKSSASNTKTLSNNSIYSIYQAKNGLIWIGTSDGLNIYNPITKQIERIGVNNGLPKGLVMGILEDNDGNIWVSTSKGVARIEPQTRFIRSYDKHDGWLNTEFSEGAYFKSKTGELFFGGIDGITYFNPKEITQNNFLPGISVDILRQKGTFVNFSKADTFKKYCIYIPYKQRNVQIRIQAYHYSNPGRNQIAYKLSSDKSWHYVYSSKAELNINTLKPGTHQLLIKAANADGLWTKPMNIRVRIGFPFWMSTWFWISIVLIGLAGSFIFIRVRLSQERRRNLQLKKLVEERTCEIESQRHQLEIQNKELELIHLQTLKQKEQIVAQHEHLLELHEKLKEVNELKMNFFTNISHEIRTPLTLISGPIENLLLGGEMNSNQMEQLFTVRQQTSYLLSLVNQLLDYRKLESGSAALNMAPGELISFCKGVCQPFLFEAHSRNITFSFQTEIEILHCMFDGEKVRQIISNLISNALKFTPDEGEIRIEIRLSLPTGQVIIHVEDNGIGIPSNRLGLIFDRFYQVGKSINPHTPGTGIGLSLALELAKVHQGDLTVKSQEGQGSVFSLFLPFVPLKESRAEESSIDSEIQYQSSIFDDVLDNQN
ncbi:MAG TPA: two-component regulator propeller domain-containing protein, partial [Bacteroidales bacterium]|nr:two-component regulator propeller domain-containing protein [Bacteroidales bacterium]